MTTTTIRPSAAREIDSSERTDAIQVRRNGRVRVVRTARPTDARASKVGKTTSGNE